MFINKLLNRPQSSHQPTRLHKPQKRINQPQLQQLQLNIQLLMSLKVVNQQELQQQMQQKRVLWLDQFPGYLLITIMIPKRLHLNQIQKRIFTYLIPSLYVHKQVLGFILMLTVFKLFDSQYCRLPQSYIDQLHLKQVVLVKQLLKIN